MHSSEGEIKLKQSVKKKSGRGEEGAAMLAHANMASMYAAVDAEPQGIFLHLKKKKKAMWLS